MSSTANQIWEAISNHSRHTRRAGRKSYRRRRCWPSRRRQRRSLEARHYRHREPSRPTCRRGQCHSAGRQQGRQLQPKEFEILAHLGIGLTDICKKTSGVDTRLGTKDFDVDGLVQRLRAIQPSIIAFNGKKAASIYFNCDTRDIDYGRQARGRAGANLNSTVFVLPSTSGSAKNYWDQRHWRVVADEFRALRST